MCVRVMCGTWLYLHDYHLYERTSACNYQLYDCYQNAVNDRLLLMIWPICMIIICMDAHQRVITDCNQCECLAISDPGGLAAGGVGPSAGTTVNGRGATGLFLQTTHAE